RGALVMTGGTSAGAPIAVPTGAFSQGSGPVRVRTGGAQVTDAAIAGGATIGATGEPFVSGGTGAPAAPKKGFPVALVAIPLVLVAGGAAFFLFGSNKGGQAPPVPPSTATAASLPTATAAVAAEKTKCPDGAVLIKGGKMFMGARDLTEASRPPHEVTVSTFCLDRIEVTTTAYLACVDKGECERPLDHVSWPGIEKDKEKRYSPLCNATHKDRGDHPINCVAWAMADNYCKKTGRRLPSEAEWEFAARGSSQRKYPWGDDASTGKFL